MNTKTNRRTMVGLLVLFSGACGGESIGNDTASQIGTREDPVVVLATGLAKDVGAGPNGTIWAIGTTSTTGGFRAFKYDFGQAAWFGASNTHGGLRISVGSGDEPWIVDNQGVVFKLSNSVPATGTWSSIAMGGIFATDIGVGPDGSVWITGNSNLSSDNIYKLVNGQWVNVGRPANRIAVGPAGIPWIVTPTGTIFFRTSSVPGQGTWTQTSGSAKDIAVAPDNTVWSVSRTATGGAGDFRIQKFTGPAPGTWTMTNSTGGGINIAIEHPPADTLPWIVNTAGNIYRLTPGSITGTFIQK